MENLLTKKICILESALELINENGFHGSPISKVAKNAGVAAGSIYTYFESKEELILGIYDYVTESIKNYISERDDDTLDFKTRFFNYWKNYTDFYDQNPSKHGFYNQFLNSPFYSEKSQQKPNDWHEWSNSFFRSGIDQGVIKNINPTVLAILVNSNIRSIVSINNNFKQKLASNNVNLAEISQLIWKGIKND
jgi:AcrR family transcriptional regulator